MRFFGESRSNNSDEGADLGNSDPREIYPKVEKIAGWLNKPAAYLTFDILKWQDESQIEGSFLEIGVFCGKYFSILMQSALRTKSPILGIDTFQFANPERVYKEIANVFGSRLDDQMTLWKKPSVEIRPEDIETAIGRCRFISIDGAHDFENVFRDLVLAEQVLSKDGLIAADDFLNPVALGVNQAINLFLSQPRLVVPIAYTANKLFLAHRARAEDYRVAIEKIFETGEEPFVQHFRKQRGHGRHHVEQEFYGHKVLLR